MKNKYSFGKILFLLILVVAGYVLFKHFDQSKQIIDALTAGDWRWVMLAVIVQIFYYPLYAKYLKIYFNFFGLNYTFKNLLQLYCASKFTDVALPIATVGKVALYSAEAKKEGKPVVSATFAALTVAIGDLAIFWVIALLPFLFFGDNHVAGGYYKTAFLIFTLIVFVLGTVALLYMKNRKFGKKIFDWLSGSLKKFGIDLPGEESPKVSGRIREYLPKAFYLGLILQLINIVTLGLILLAFGQGSHLYQTLIFYAVGTLFTVVSITPQGAGVAEGAMTLAMTSLGMPVGNALLIVLSYRGILYWIPFILGFWPFHRLNLFNQTK